MELQKKRYRGMMGRVVRKRQAQSNSLAKQGSE